MDVVWLVVDSLSFGATSFAEEGPETTPNLYKLAESDGVIFQKAYAPGPLSPSSHVAMLTGELPSTAGMHEANPQFNGSVSTIAQRMQETHATHLLSVNMWLFQGLARGFDQARDFSRRYRLFHEATDPLDYFDKHGSPDSLYDIYRLIADGGKPIRSLANYVNYRRTGGSFVPKKWGDSEEYQYADKINDELTSSLKTDGEDRFVFVNYMDVHPPFSASDETLERFAPNTPREALPIGSVPEPHVPNNDKSYDPELMERLYRAVIWDFDDKMGPMLQKLLTDDRLVIITSDHGIWDRDTTYSKNHLHVPLIIFAPDEPPRTVEKTVNLRSLPRTIVQYVNGHTGEFDGEFLLNLTDDETSVTETLHYPNEAYEMTSRIDATAHDESSDPQRDLVLIRGESRVEYIDGLWDGDDEELRARGKEILSTTPAGTDTDVEYDATTMKRLEDFGYL